MARSSLRGAMLRSCLSVCALLAMARAAPAETTTPIRAADFLDSIGVNIHMAFTDSAYADVDRVRGALAYTGIHQVRNLLQSNSVDPAGHIHLDRLAASGICRFTFVATDPDLPQAIAWLDAFAAKYPGRITAIEGPNEVDHWPVSYGGSSGRPAAVAYQRDLSKAVRADARLAGISLFALTGLGTSWSDDLSDTVDFGNEHPYARDGAPPAARLLAEIAATHRRVAPARPMVVTESGYPTLVGHSEIKFGRDGVSEDVQQRFTLDTLLDFRKAGVARTYLYELLDEKSDPDGRSIERHYGLFKVDGTPKKAATALRNLSTILADPGSKAGTFATKTVDVTISGLGEHGSSIVFQKSDGSLQVIVWAEPAIWTPATGTMGAVDERPATITLTTSIDHADVYDPIVGTAPIGTAANTDRITVQVTDHPIIIAFKPARP